MKNKTKLSFLIVSLLLFLSALVISLRFLSTQDTTMETKKDRVLAYRFACVYSGSSDYFKASLKEGLDKAAEDMDAWVQFYKFKSFEIEKHCEAIDKMVASKVDGIITNVPDTNSVMAAIEAAYGKKIPVITIETDLPNSKRISFIGTNSYAYGVEAGKLMAAATNGTANIGIFKNYDTGKFNLKNQGFQSSIKAKPSMKAEVFDVKEPRIIEYTNVTRSIFVENNRINSFFCSDTESTIGVVRAMIEFNKTNSVVIGAGDSEEILKYVKNGIIYASLAEDPYTTGYLSISNLIKHKNGESISEFVNPEILIISKDNIEAVLTERKEKK